MGNGKWQIANRKGSNQVTWATVICKSIFPDSMKEQKSLSEVKDW